MKRLRKYQSVLIVTAVLLAVFSGIYLFLLSEYSMRHLWFPLVEEKTGISISAKECSVSLFRKRTFYARGLILTGADFSVSAGIMELESSPLEYLFGEIYPIHSLYLDGVKADFAGTVSSDFSGKPGKKQASGKSEKRKGSYAEITFPVSVENFSLRDLDMSVQQKNGDKWSITDADVTISQLIPNSDAEVRTVGYFHGIFGNIQVEKTEISSYLRFTFPERGFLPQKFNLNVSTGHASIKAGDFSSAGNTLALIAALEWKEKEVVLKSGSFNIGNEKGGDILSLNISGEVAKDYNDGYLSGKMKFYSSALTDAVFTNLFQAKITGFSADCVFNSRIRQGKLYSDANARIVADSVAPWGSLNHQPVLKPEIHAKATVSGIPKNLELCLDKAQLSIRRQEKILGKAELLAPWDFLQKGDLVFFPLPEAEVQMDQFPLSAFIPFGLNKKYYQGSISLQIRSKPGRENGSELTLEGKTGFPVAEIGPFSVRAVLEFQKENIILRESRIFCGTEKKSVSVGMNGRFDRKPGAVELESSIVIRNPEQIFRNKLFRGIDEIKPEIQFKGVSGNETADLWLEAACGKYRMNLTSKVTRPEKNDGSWESKGLNTPGTTVNFRAGEQELMNLSVNFSIPGDLSWNRMTLSGRTKTWNPQFFREISSFLPENLDFDRTKSMLFFSLSGGKKVWNLNADFSQKHIFFKDQQTGKKSDLSHHISFSASKKEKEITLRKSNLEMQIDGRKAAILSLSGTLPSGKTGKYRLNLLSDRLDLSALLKLKQALNSRQKKSRKVSVSATPVSTGKKQEFQLPYLNLAPWNGSLLEFNLKRLIFTEDISADWKGSAKISGKTFSLHTKDLEINRQKGNLDFSVDPSANGKYPCTLNIKLSDLPLEPVFRELKGTENPGVKGTLRELDASLAGNGPSLRQIKHSLSGSCRMDFSKLSLNIQKTSDSDLVKVILVPFDAISQAVSANAELRESPAGRRVLNFGAKIKEIFSGKRNLDFSAVSGDFLCRNGEVRIRKLNLIDGIVDSEEITGKVFLPTGKIQLEAVTTIRGVMVPVYLKGTLDRVRIDRSRTVKGLLLNNARKILQSEDENNSISVNELIQLFQ